MRRRRPDWHALIGVSTGARRPRVMTRGKLVHVDCLFCGRGLAVRVIAACLVASVPWILRLILRRQQQCLHVLSVIAGLDARGVPVWNDMSASGPAQLTAVTVLQGRDLHLCAGILTRRPDGDEHPPTTARGLIYPAMTIVYFFLLRPYFRSRGRRFRTGGSERHRCVGCPLLCASNPGEIPICTFS